jgi:hypothetical protein
LSWHVKPHQRAEEETRIVSAVGEWIRSEVLGPVAAALVKARPATVRVAVPEEAEELLARPLELGHVRALQYGVTRDRLQDVLADDEGWDAIHISGHGSPGRLLLETEAGKPDRVSAAQLADLLDLAGGRLKLVTISVCWSAALAVAEQRRLLGLPVQDETADLFASAGANFDFAAVPLARPGAGSPQASDQGSCSRPGSNPEPAAIVPGWAQVLAASDGFPAPGGGGCL